MRFQEFINSVQEKGGDNLSAQDAEKIAEKILGRWHEESCELSDFAEWIKEYMQEVVIPEIGSKWRALNNEDAPEYTVIHIANTGNDSHDYPVIVIFKGDIANVLAKTLSDFNQQMRKLS